jgi:hypothetical protein
MINVHIFKEEKKNNNKFMILKTNFIFKAQANK